MAEALISVLLERLALVTYHHIEEEVKLVLNGEKDVAKFISNFKLVGAVLEDAEKRQVKEAEVRDWLDKLKDVSYEMDDVLDEWNTEIMKHQVEKQEKEGEDAHVTKKVLFSIPVDSFCFGKVNRVIVHRKIALKIKELNDALDEIANTRGRFNFQFAKDCIEQPEREKSSSFIDISMIFGREKEKDILVNKLLSKSSQEEIKLLIIPIVGMGGIGKTTLSQLAYNDENVKVHFDKRIWVSVSDPFDVIKIAKAINSGANALNPVSDELEDFLQLMSQSLRDKKFLLVLDDVWTKDHRKWEQLKLPLMHGAKGSIILVATRKHEVAIMIGATSNAIHLEELSEQNCLALFNHIAFFDRQEESNVFGSVGKEVAKRCKGLPLAAKTLGSLMLYKRTMEEWEDVLNSNIWDLEEVEPQIFQPLLLSYYDLTPAVKRCLLYCAIFPKNYEFDRENLIELWMSQDYLNWNEHKEKGIIGQRFFDNLVMRSFFQDCVEDYNGNIRWFKMHDIVHDFVQFLSKNECLVVDCKDPNKRIELLGANDRVSGDRVRHLAIMFAPKGPFPSSSISFCNRKNLRTLITFDSTITTLDLNLILQLKCLRTLNLSYNNIRQLPKEIGELFHLRYIDLSKNPLGILPNTICNLYNLQTLHLISCIALQYLPEAMGKLINLKHLHVKGCWDLHFLPKEIGRITGLKTLDECALGQPEEERAFRLEDLGSLDQLQGSLVIKARRDLKNVRTARGARLYSKKLFHLELDSKNWKKTRQSNEYMLSALRPHHHLESLSICWNDGNTGPRWMEHSSFYSLRILTLSCWLRYEVLPPLGKFPSLEKLRIAKFPRVKKVGVEFLGIEETDQPSRSPGGKDGRFVFDIWGRKNVLFPKLKQLYLEEMGVLGRSTGR